LHSKGLFALSKNAAKTAKRVKTPKPSAQRDALPTILITILAYLMAVLPPESIHAPSKKGGISGKTLDAADGKKEPIRSVSREEKPRPYPRCCKYR